MAAEGDQEGARTGAAAVPAFAEPLHVGRPNVGDREKFLRLVGEMFDRGWIANDGPLVREFEARIAERSGVRHCVAMCNGTLALEIGIRALGLTGEVIVPSFTFVATAHALFWQGITPVFADIDPKTHTLDPEAVRRMITPRTTGIIGVHLWGRPADVDGLQHVADEHGLHLMYDAAHAFDCTLGARPIGSFGELSVLSFHATKFFNTFEGGAVLTDDDELAGAMRLMRNFGFAGYDDVIHPGTNGKMTEVCAAMGLANLDSIESTLETNKRNHAAYSEVVADLPGITVLPPDGRGRWNHQYVVLEVDESCPRTRDELLHALWSQNVLARRYFWPGAHRMKPYRDLYPHAGLLLPQTEAVAEGVLIMPTGTAVSVENIARIGELVRTEVSRAG